MKRIWKATVALVLVISMVTGLIPADVLGPRLKAARAEAAQQQAIARAAEEVTARLNAQFDELAALAAERADQQQTDGEWQYVLLEEYHYAVITGHTDQGAAQVDIPAMLGGADVVALSGEVFAGHDALYAVTMTGNVYHADAASIPRGVTVRGFSGSYAQSWAQDNRHAFENLSQLDFLEGVADLSDVAQSRFVRHSALSVTLGELEARRLEEGSIFFLADPNNLYAVSFYRVVSMSDAENGFVSIACETPEVKHVLRSFHFEDQEMVADWSTMQLYDGVEGEVLTPKDRASNGAEYECGFSFTPKIKIGSSGSFTFSTKYLIKSKMTADYANLKLNTFKLVTEESVAITGKLAYKNALLNEDKEPGDPSLDDRLKQMIKMAEDQVLIKDEVVKTNQPLCVVTMFSLWGILNFTMEAGFNVEYAGSLEVGYTSKTLTTYHYVNGEMKSTSEKLEEGTTFTANAEVKIGITVSFNVLLFVVEVAQMELFLGLKGTAAYTRTYNSYDPESRTYWADTSLEAHNRAVLKGDLSLAYLNMTDCVEIDVSLLAEVSITLGNDYVSFAKLTVTLLEIPLLDLHWHFTPTKYSLASGELDLVNKQKGDWLHDSIKCPLKDQVSLMVPELDKAEPMGVCTLRGKSQIPEPPVLELPDYSVRVTEWFLDEKLQRPVTSWPYTAASGSFLYGKAEQVTVATLINFDGNILNAEDGKDAIVCLGEDETVNTSDLNLADEAHIAGWVQVDNQDDRNLIGDILWQKNLPLTSTGENTVWMAILDNDITITFKDSENQVIKTYTTGHYIEIPESDLPPFPVLYDPAYALATYEWRDVHGKAYEFPLVPDITIPDIFTLYMVPTGIDRVFEADDEPSVITGGAVDESGLTTYSSKDYFEYTNYGYYVCIDGFRANQSYQDENGEWVHWTAVPEKLVIPAYIDDVPVQAIDHYAFEELETLVSVTLPSTIQSIGNGAFRDCVNLKKLDLSACTTLFTLPHLMASGCSSLSAISLPRSITSIGGYAFRDCTSLTSAVINAAIGDRAFEGCTGLTSVQLRYGVSAIGEFAFLNCTGLTSLTVPCSAKTVGDSFIQGCTGLNSLTLDGAPAKVTADTLYIHNTESSLQTLTLCLGVTEIGANAFSTHSKLSSITLPEAMRSVGAGALNGTAVEYLKIHDLGMLGTGFARDCKTLREIDFDKGVISAEAFAYCTNLETITMGDQVFAIGDQAFRGCTALTHVTFGTGVEQLGDSAFEDCKNLQSVTMGEGLKTVGNDVFAGCTALEEIVFPASVEAFGTHILASCESVKHITIGGPALPTLPNGQLFGYLGNSALETITVREGVETIGSRAFGNINEYSTQYGYSKLHTVALPSTLTTIEKEAFEGNRSLVNVTLPASLKTIGDEAFENCNALVLSCAAGLELESIGARAFAECHSLQTIQLGHTLTSLPDGVFYNCRSLTELEIPETVTSIGDKILYGCESLKKLTMGGPGLPVITSGQILGYLPNSVLETVILREGVTTIGSRAFSNINEYGTQYGHRSLHTVVLPSTLTTIDKEAFEFATALTGVALPSSLKTIGMEAFSGCSALTLSCPEDLELESIGDAAFRSCKSMTAINLGHTLTEIPADLFEDCEALEELVIPETVSVIGNHFLAGCSGLQSLTLGGPSLPVITNGQIFGYLDGAALETIILREGVETIGSRAFSNINEYGTQYGYPNLHTVVLPSTLTTIDKEAFEFDRKLKNVNLPAGLQTIGMDAFSGCESLVLACPEKANLLSIGDGAFRGCKSLPAINLGDSLQTVGTEAFQNCVSLTALSFPPSVTSYGTQIVGGAEALRVLRIGGWGTPELTNAQLLGRQESEVLETLIIGEGVTSIGARVFANVNSYGTVYGFQRLRSISLPSTLTAIGSEAFHSSGVLTRVNLPDGMASIADNAFQSCPKLTSVHSYTHSSAIAAFAETNGYAYTTDRGALAMVQLCLMNGEETLHTRSVQAGESVAETLRQHQPAAPEETAFHRWYMDAELTLPWQADDMPAFDLTLYAGFVPAHTASFTALLNGEVVEETAFVVGEGHLIPWPDDPEAAGCLFEGWYLDEAFTQPLTAAHCMGTEDVNVYGRLTAMSGSAVYAAYEDGVALVSWTPAENQTECWLPGTVNGLKLVAIAQDAFANAQAITRLHLPDHLAAVDAQALNALENLQFLFTGPNSRHFTAVDGVLYTRDLQTLVCFPRSKPAVSYTAPAAVTAAAPFAFANARWLQNVTLHAGVKTLGDYALSGCSLRTLRAYGLETIGTEALPAWNADMRVYGPVKTGVLRDSLLMTTEDGYTTFKAPYNLYGVSLYVNNGLVNTIGLEAGSVLPADFVYGEMADGTVIHTWYTDKDFTTAWDPAAVTPEHDISLYTPSTPIIRYQNAVFTVDGAEVNGLLLTAYNGTGGALVLPSVIGGAPVMGIGENFLLSSQGVVNSVQIPSSVIQIADTALIGPEAYPFGGTVKADEGSYAAEWAVRMGYTAASGLYTLAFQSNGGSSVAPRTVAYLTSVKLPEPVKTGCTFAGWYTDAKLTASAELTDGCFTMPAADTTLYAAWTGTAQTWPFTWEETNGQITITGPNGKVSELVIPETVNGLSVTAIADGAFRGNETLTSLTLPESLRAIGSSAFSGTKITAAQLGGTQTLAADAFAGCAQLSDLTADCLTALGDRAFAGCESLNAFRVPESLVSISASAFDGCTGLAAFTADEANTLYSAVDGLLVQSGISLLRYPEGRTDAACTLPSGVRIIGPGAFRGAGYLNEITLPDDLLSIGAKAFAGSGITSFALTDAMEVSEIPAGAFENCARLENVTFSGRVTAIGENAFLGCTALKQITIPETVTTIAPAAFSSASGLTICGVHGSAAYEYAMANSIPFVDPSAVDVTALTIENDVNLMQGQTITLTAALTPAGAVLYGDLVWTSSDPTVLSIHQNTAFALGYGTATVTVTAPNGVAASAEFQVTRSPDVRLSAAAATLLPGQRVRAEVLNAAAPAAWVSSDETVASVKNGVITALAPGEAVISAGTLTLEITVVSALSTLTLPAALQTVETDAFAGSAAGRITAGDGVTAIGARAFADMPALQQLILPASLTGLAADALDGSPSAVLLCPEGSFAHRFASENDLAYLVVEEP